MIALMNWLQANKHKSILIVIVYYTLVILPHEWVGVNITKVFSGMSRDQYNLIILILFCLIFLGLTLLLFKKLMRHQDKQKLLAYYAFTIASIIIVSRYLFVINIECVHYVQYAIGAILLFSLFQNYFVALFIAFLIGVIDEGYQYFYLSPQRTDYFDINDIITNLLGAAVGLLILKTYQTPQNENHKKMIKRGFLIPSIVLSTFFILILRSSYLSIYPSDDTFTLIRKLQPGYWTTVPPQVTFHVVQPFEGLIIIVVIFAVYYFCFKPSDSELR